MSITIPKAGAGDHKISAVVGSGRKVTTADGERSWHPRSYLRHGGPGDAGPDGRPDRQADPSPDCGTDAGADGRTHTETHSVDRPDRGTDIRADRSAESTPAVTPAPTERRRQPPG